MLCLTLLTCLTLAFVTATEDVCFGINEFYDGQNCILWKSSIPCTTAGHGGNNTVCKVVDQTTFCSCMPGHYGDPATGCTAGCGEGGECPEDQSCVNHNCEDPCRGGCGVTNTVCKVKNHRPFCSCMPGHYGDPTSGCIAGCGQDGECPEDQWCVNHKCEDPCMSGCGVANTVCKVNNHRPFCYSMPGHHVYPTTGHTVIPNGSKNFPLLETNKTFYVETNFQLNWHAAYMYCRTQGMRLATILNKEENDEMLAEIHRTYQGDGTYEVGFWLGCSELGLLGTWRWMTTGQALQGGFTDWLVGQPNNPAYEHCLDLWTLKWNDADCEEALFFVCENSTYQSSCIN